MPSLIVEYFGIEIPDEEMGKKAFASIDALTDFIVAEHGRGGLARKTS